MVERAGYRFERVMPMSSETRREAVYRDGEYIGEVVYIARRRKARGVEIESSSTGFITEHGWRPDGWRYAKNVKLTDRQGAADRLTSILEVRA